jgi:hypothetical protein
MVFSVPTKTHGYSIPLTVTGAVFTGVGRGMRKYTQGLPVSCLSYPRNLGERPGASCPGYMQGLLHLPLLSGQNEFGGG